MGDRWVELTWCVCGCVQLLEAKTIQLQQLQSSSAQQLKSLQESLDQEEATVTGLRQSLMDTEQQLSASTQSYTDVRCLMVSANYYSCLIYQTFPSVL